MPKRGREFKSSTQRSKKKARYVAPYRYNPRQYQVGEWKYLLTGGAGLTMAMDTACQAVLLNGMATGATAITRVGMRISIQSVELRLLTIATIGTGTDQSHRFLLVLDRQANGLIPGNGNALQACQAVLDTADVVGQRNLASRKRYKILMDKTVRLNASGESGAQAYIKKYIRFSPPIVVEYNTGVAGLVADITTNSLYLMAIGSNAAGVTAGTVAYNVRIRFSDS